MEGSARSVSSHWIHLLARSGSCNQTHLAWCQFKLCALYICKSALSCHSKTNSLLATSLRLVLYGNKQSNNGMIEITSPIQNFDPNVKNLSIDTFIISCGGRKCVYSHQLFEIGHQRSYSKSTKQEKLLKEEGRWINLSNAEGGFTPKLA